MTARDLTELRQELLLKAALLPGAAARDAWEYWRSITDIDDAPPGSHRLMPLIHRNLEPLRTEYSDSGRLTGIRRKNFVQNQLLFRAAADVLTCLRGAGIETMVLGGAALATEYYRDAGTRPMRNVDIFVPEHKVQDAARLLGGGGWREVNPALSVFAAGFRRYDTAVAFHGPSGLELRLHWHVLPWCGSSKTDEGFWSASTRTVLHGVETRILSPSDQLLYTCLASLKWSYEPPFWRVADVVTVVNACGTIDADRLLSLATNHHLEFLLYRALKRVPEDFGAQVPEELLASLAGKPVSRNDRYEYEYLTQPYFKRSVGAWLVGFYREHRRNGNGTIVGHLWRTLRWAILPKLILRMAAMTVGTKLPKHPNRARPSPVDAEEPAHHPRRAAPRPTVLPG